MQHRRQRLSAQQLAPQRRRAGPGRLPGSQCSGHIALYPMHSPNRRMERRQDVIELLKTEYRVQDVIDYSGLESDGLFLEGTGAMVLDHVAHIAYTARSNRANAIALECFATHFNYEPMAFDAVDAGGCAVYHTNVLMCVASDYALIGLNLITDARRRAEACQRQEESGREVIALSAAQIEVIERSAKLLPLAVPTIELAGGSVRCMLASVHLSRR